MNRQYFFATLFLSALCLISKAQTADPELDNYSRLDVSYVSQQPVDIEAGIPLVSNHSLTGVSLAYTFGINVTGHSTPLFLEVGPDISYTQRTDEVDIWYDAFSVVHEDVKMQILSLGTPLNLTYRLPLSDAFVLAPSAGLNAKLNLLAKTSSGGETADLLDHGAKRFQLGCNAGCGIYYGRYYLGLQYAYDLTPFYTYQQGHEKERYQQFRLSLGYRF